MSEEVLRALIQLFALILKQDEGAGTVEKDYVRDFLSQQLGSVGSQPYLDDFNAELSKGGGGRLTSVRDSVRVLALCKKINRTLNQSQKLVVLVRLFELVNTDRRFSDQRMAILETVGEVFMVSREEYSDIDAFVRGDSFEELDRPSILLAHGGSDTYAHAKYIHVEGQSSSEPLVILRVSSQELYFMRYLGSGGGGGVPSEFSEEVSVLDGKRGEDDFTLNGLPVQPGRVYLLPSGSNVKTKGKPVYYTDVVAHFMADMAVDSISFVVEGVSYRFASGAYGLHEISFSEEHGRLVGIMGASGAGKTTLLNVLCGQGKPSDGRVLINGLDLYDPSDREALEGTIGLIPQDDLLIEELTVFENLYYSAKLCFRDKDEATLRALVDATLRSLGLYERRDLKVGSPLNKMISGGQRKRLNIALELIREPSILFVDEPTSGLSSRDSENVMDLLRELALKGKLIFVVIHQPSSDIYKMFDDMLILDTGGYLIYAGNPVEAVTYFKTADRQVNSEVGECPTCGNVNPELIFNIVEAHVVDEFGHYTPKRKVSPEEWRSEFDESRGTVNLEPRYRTPPPRSLNIPSRLTQFLIYTARDFRSKVSNVQYIVLNLLETPILAFILAFVIRYIPDPNSDVYVFRDNENIPIYIFMALIVALFIGLTVSAEEIFRDRKILKRERFLNLSRASYLLSKVFILLCLSAVQTLTFVLIANGILSLRGLNFQYWLMLFSTSVCANMIGLNISNTFNSVVTIYIVIPLLMIPMMVLSGAMFSFEKLNRAVGSFNRVPLIADLMPTKWGYEALVVLQFKDNEFQKYFYDIEKEERGANYRMVYYLPELKSRVEYSIANLENRRDAEVRARMEDGLAVLRRAFKLERELLSPEIPYGDVGSLHVDSIDVYSLYEAVGYLEELEEKYSTLFQQKNRQRDAIVTHLMSTSPELYEQKRAMYHNESISDLALKVFEKNKILQFRDELVQQYDPVYRDPIPRHALDFQSHFLAPRKHFLGHYFDTYWFNLSVVWLMSVVLYITLYYSSLVRLGEFFASLRGRIRKK